MSKAITEFRGAMGRAETDIEKRMMDKMSEAAWIASVNGVTREIFLRMAICAAMGIANEDVGR